MSSVFLTNVDDYLAPSQACVNPLFAHDNNNNNKKKKEEDTEPVVKRRVVRRRNNNNNNNKTPTNNITAPAIPQKTVKEEFSLADCLACSGCVTTAETVLIEQHSLDSLKISCRQAASSERLVCVTVSPASLADLMRSLHIESDYVTWFRRLASFLHNACHASIVLDGNVPLGYSLMEAAHEFCHAYKQQQQEKDESAMDIDIMDEDVNEEKSIPLDTPSVALSASQTRYMLPAGDKVVTHKPGRRPGSTPRLPLVTSSCPALVCLVEKSISNAVPHLQSTKSPMAVAGTLLKKVQPDCLHIAIMPCHDKKLEASRKDLQQQSSDVDLVITTREWLDLLQESVRDSMSMTNGNKPSVMEMRSFLEPLPLSPVQPTMAFSGAQGPVLVSEMTQESVSNNNYKESSSAFYPFGSGGHADFCFRFAAQHLFGCEVQQVLWKPVVSQRRAVSARVSAAGNKNVDYLSATLYRHGDGTYSCREGQDSTPVLRFATAYGLQNIQRVLQPFKGNKNNYTSPYHYIEAMACPSGCLNGGGQARLVQRETPTETRQRVRETQRVMEKQQPNCPIQQPQVYPTTNGPFGSEAQELLHTRFHVVPQLQTNGTSNGMVVDTRW